MPDRISRITLKPRRARPFFARHPWVFVTSVARVEGDPAPGDEVEVFSHEGQFIARGLFNPKSAIRVRLYRWDDGPLNPDFWSDKLDAALRLRTETLRLPGPSAAYRVVSSEGDGLSGLTVDRYDRWLVVQFSSLALHGRGDAIVADLLEKTGAEGAVVRVDRSTAEREGMIGESPTIVGDVPTSPVEIVEHGLTYWVDVRGGQKTGFFLDQRENRRVVAGHCAGKRVLDLYTYTGGFALNAAKPGGAAEVVGIDSSSTAVEVATHHATLNGVSNARFERGDALSRLDEYRSRGERFGVVVCDPPKFARSARGVEDALKAYLTLNRAAVEVVEPGGILVTCSCSGSVDRGLFADVLGQVSELSSRPIQILEQRGQAPDHPVSASCLETEYLKCFVCRVI
ncbi:MAG: class I SAM-dependent rRNA methyltransferase [Isosphaeraceae bacterium]